MKLSIEAGATELSDFLIKLIEKGKNVREETLLRKIVREEMNGVVGRIRSGRLEFVSNDTTNKGNDEAKEDGEQTNER